jgi:superfamily II DNA or RNA helicase
MLNTPLISEIYQNLDETEKSIVDLAILIFEPFSDYEFSNFYNSYIKKIPQYKFKNVFNVLKASKILVAFDNYKQQLNTDFLLAMFPEIIRRPESVKFMQEVEKAFKDQSFYYGKSIITWRVTRQLLTDYFLEHKEHMELSLELVFKHKEDGNHIFRGMARLDVYDGIIVRLRPELFDYTLNSLLIGSLYGFEDLNRLGHLTRLPVEKGLIATQETIKAAIYMFQGQLTQSAGHIKNKLPGLSSWVNSIVLAYQGQHAKAVETFDFALTENRKMTTNPKFTPDNFYTFFYFLELLVYRPGTHQAALGKYVKILQKSEFFDDQQMLALSYLANNQRYEASKLIARFNEDKAPEYNPFCRMVYIISMFLIQEKLSSGLRLEAIKLLKLALENNYLLFAGELDWVLSQTGKDHKMNRKLFENLGIKSLLSQIEQTEKWEEALNSLLVVGSGKVKHDKAGKEVESNRLVYFVDFENDRNYIQPMLQTFSTKGWSKGRNIALKRLKEHQLDCMTEQDNRIASAIKHENSYYGSEYYIDYQKMLPELAGHPYLFYAQNPDISMELVKAQPELVTEKTSKGYLLQTNIRETEKKQIILKETNTRYKLIQLTEEQLMVIRAMNNGKLVVPESGKDKLMKVIAHLSSFMTIHSDIAGGGDNLKNVEADSRIRVQLLPVGDSLKAEWFVKPFGHVPPYSKPGKGGKTVYATMENEKCVANRDLNLETKNARKLSEAFSGTLETDLSEGPVVFDDPHECLALLEILKQQTDIAIVEWPEGERFRIRRSIAFKQLNLSVKGKGYWFELSGELKVDEDTVLTLKQLLELTSKSKGRFVELGNGEFIALTEELKKRLEELALFSTIDKTGVKLNKFAVPAIEELSQSAGSFKTDKAWKDFQKVIESNREKTYHVPANLQAELRPYQEEGFYWMARLADWDAGACLADDMGLGKTLQALALLLHRADNGPALVVCPASVVANWVAEAARFAPSLNIHVFKTGNREAVLEGLTSLDVLVITYGILQSEEERLGKITWATVVLDEAHAIKNNQTKTSRAAMGIQAGFRLILTGTPVQNHLGEIWNLFNFINPGLLGSLQQFNERFVNIVDRNGNALDRNHLKKLLSPFILRRTKTNVLDDLPPKTEITHRVELSDEEMAFYEALRRQAIETIELAEGPSGQQHLKALAEITRLRLACCHPSLVNDDLEIPSSKLNVFLDLVDELLENKHRALVFSQFIGHLSIVRKALDKKKISYQYLDGSTTINSRAGIVKDFQSGKGDLFLISLKAGGLGLNLTAADYVIHLDPWWNPAIEDQASDRAHRIGQSRPVTIYRLVAKDTIEEKIIQLHHSKRDMADSLLDGSDQAAKFSTDDLLNLLKEI